MIQGRTTVEAILRPPRRRFAGYVFDLNGTVYLGEELLPGAEETIRRIREGGGRVVFVTNESMESAADYAAKLTRLGIPTEPDAILTALDSVRLYLTERHFRARLLVVSEPLVKTVLSSWGWILVEDPAEADLVLVSFDRTFDYAKLRAAYRAVVEHGASIVATNPDPYRPTPQGPQPDSASILAAIEACTGTRAEAVLGKPSLAMGSALLDRLGTAPGDSALVGDRLVTDVPMGQSINMASVLVLGGATSVYEVVDSEIHPDYVIEGIYQLLPE